MCSRSPLDSSREDIENIALLELFRITRITLQCPIHESSLWNCYWMGCRRYFAAGRLEVLLDEDDFRSSSKALKRVCFLFVSQLHVQSRHSEVNVYFLALCDKSMDCSLSTSLTVLVWSASTFSSASSSLCTRSTDTGTQLWLHGGQSTSLTVLEFLLSRPNKTSLLISWVSKPDGCSLTGLPVLDNCFFFDFGWICWESSLPPATPESKSFI